MWTGSLSRWRSRRREYKLGEVSLAGGFAAKSAELLKIAKFKPASRQFRRRHARRRAHQEAPERQGYMHAETTIERALNEKPRQ